MFHPSVVWTWRLLSSPMTQEQCFESPRGDFRSETPLAAPLFPEGKEKAICDVGASGPRHRRISSIW